MKTIDELLLIAIEKGDLEWVRLLVKTGQVSQDCKNEALVMAAGFGYFETVRYLISQGAAKIHFAISQAITCNNPDIADYLRSFKPKPTIESYMRATCYITYAIMEDDENLLMSRFEKLKQEFDLDVLKFLFGDVFIRVLKTLARDTNKPNASRALTKIYNQLQELDK